MQYKFAAAALALVLSAPVLAQKTKWDLPTGYAENNFHTQNLRWFADEVKKATRGDVDIVVHSNASLFKLPDIKRAVQGGQVPAGEILLSLHGNEDPILEADMIPFLAAGFDNAWKLYTVQKPVLQDRLGKQGMRMLYSVAWPGNGIFSKTPMDSLAAFKGAKFRAYNRVTARFAEELGAQPTTIQAAELAQAFTMNMATTMIASPQIGVDTKAWEFLTSFYDTNAMHPRNAVIVNEREFAKLTKENQDAIVRVAAQAEARGWDLARAAAKASTDALSKNGVKVYEPSPAMRADFQRVSQKLIDEWSQKAGADGERIVRGMR
ncbi:MAG TPA: TRAP transporter substrate-binding protein [Ramlibacter sp.]|jgi:TRAP-type C4-dicarboxylate transport system substrate-binding protein|nr:TRAP transporter substrate-binding protein [Ramlibacter sp.]